MNVSLNRTKLCMALLSGEYEQGRRGLKIVDPHGNETFCPMGVACDLYIKNNPETNFKWIDPKGNKFSVRSTFKSNDYDKYREFTPPPIVTDYFGILYYDVPKIVELNDRRGYDFSRIAEHIAQLEVTE